MMPFIVPGAVAIEATTSRWRLETYWLMAKAAALCCWFSPNLAVVVMLAAFRVIDGRLRIGDGAVRPLQPEVVRAALLGDGIETRIEVIR